MDEVEGEALVGTEGFEVAGQGGGMAGDVEDLGRRGRVEGLDGGAGAAGAGRVQEDRGVGGIAAAEQVGQLLLGAADDELAVGNVAGGSVAARGVDGGGVEFDAEEGFHGRGEFEGEEPDAAVGVEEMAGAGGLEPGADGLDELGEEVEIVLEKGIAGQFPVGGCEAKDDLQSAFGGRMGADLAQLVVQGGFGDGAAFEVDDEAVVVAEEAEVEALLGAVPLAADHDAVPVAVGLGAGDDGGDDAGREAPQAVEEVGDLLVFPAKLFGVGHVLVLATAAFAEVGAAGRDAVGRGLAHGEEAGAGKVAFDLGEFDLDLLVDEREGDEHDEVAEAAHALAAEGEVLDAEHVALAGLEGRGAGTGVLHREEVSRTRGGVHLKVEGQSNLALKGGFVFNWVDHCASLWIRQNDPGWDLPRPGCPGWRPGQPCCCTW